jgi:hypothetical protein
METIASFSTEILGEPTEVVLELDESTSPISIQVRVQRGANSTAIAVTINPETGTASLTGLAAFSPVEACLLTCAVGGVLGPIIKCFSTSPTKYRKCLKSKGLDLLSDAAKCALACATATVGSATTS